MDTASGKRVLAALIAVVTVASLANQYVDGSLRTPQAFLSGILLLFVIGLFASKRLRESYASNVLVSLLALVVAVFTIVTNEGAMAYIVAGFWVIVGLLGIYQVIQQMNLTPSKRSS
jgi:peptidoglycan/LPS O-acetylase OafA/YrhL